MLPRLAWHTPSDFMRIRYSAADGSRSLRSSEPIVVGSDSSCDIRFDDGRIDRLHAKIYPAGELWWVRDLSSHDGTFLDQECVDVAPIMGHRSLQLGADGPTIWLETDAEGIVAPAATPQKERFRTHEAMVIRAPADFEPELLKPFIDAL